MINTVRILFMTGQRKKFYLASTNVKLPGIQLVTPQSPLGATLVNKRVGQQVSYQVGETKIAATIISVE